MLCSVRITIDYRTDFGEGDWMLLLKTKRNFQQVLACAFTPLVILPATKAGETRDEAKVRANDLAVRARIEGLGVTVTESTTGELFVFASDNESQAVGFA